MHLVEKRVPGGVRDPGTLAAQGLGQQEAPLRMDERGRMELDELEVQEPRAGAPRHRDAVSPGALRVGRVEIDLSEAAGREDRLAREKRPHLAGLALEQLGSHDGRRVVPVRRIERVVGERQKVDRCGPNEPPHVLLPSARVDESAFDRRSRFVLDVQDPRHRVGSLERPVEVGALPVERHPELVDQEVAHEVGPFARQQADRFGVAQPVARADDVGGKQLGRVAGRPRDDAPLGVERVGFRDLARPGRDRHLRAVAGRGESSRAAGDAGPDHEDIRRGLHRFPIPSAGDEISSEMSAASTEWVIRPTEIESAPADA